MPKKEIVVASAVPAARRRTASCGFFAGFLFLQPIKFYHAYGVVFRRIVLFLHKR